MGRLVVPSGDRLLGWKKTCLYCHNSSMEKKEKLMDLRHGKGPFGGLQGSNKKTRVQRDQGKKRKRTMIQSQLWSCLDGWRSSFKASIT